MKARDISTAIRTPGQKPGVVLVWEILVHLHRLFYTAHSN